MFVLRNHYFTSQRRLAAILLRINVSLYSKLAVLEEKYRKTKNE